MKSTINKVIIIDDSEYKRENIKKYIKNILGTAELYLFDNVSEALCFIVNEQCEDIDSNPNSWLVITDMFMPIYKGESVQCNAGHKILRTLNREGFSCPAIVQSSDPVDDDKLEHLYRGFIGSVLEDSSSYNEYKYEELLVDYELQ